MSAVGRSRWNLSRPALAVLAVLLSFVVVSFVVRREVATENEREALEARADEVEAFFAASITSFQADLRILGGVYTATAPDVSTFQAVAASTAPIPGGEIGVVDADERETLVVVGSTDVEPGAPPRAGFTPVFDRAAELEGLVTDVVIDAEAHLLVFAQPLSGGLFIYRSVPIDPAASGESDDGPFSDMAGSVYVGSEADPEKLLVTTPGPVPSRQVRRQVPVGADEWLLVLGAEEPLTGSFEQRLPWFILVVGLGICVLATALVETLARRRAYAEDLVEERTASLEETLRALEDARATAEDANRAKSEFLSRMSHELRTPLNAVLGFAQLLELDDLNDDQRDASRQITKGGQHLLELINEILDLSRIEAGGLSLSPEPVCVSDLLDEVVDLIRPLANEAGINLTSGARPSCNVYVLADRQRAKQILLNLVANAVKYTLARGTVAVYCESRADRVIRICVADTGIGIAPEKLGLVFTPFERLGAEQQGIEGAGIGLALSQRLAEAMGGSLGVESTLGKGSNFWCDLPEVEGPVERLERLEKDAPAAPPPPEIREPVVLYIEDNLANLKLMERVLARREPHVRIVAAMQGRLGLELAREHQPAVVMLDLHLPDMTGEEVLASLRVDPLTSSIPVIMVSADASPNQIQRLLAAGAAGYITKPIDVRMVLETIDRLVDS